MGRQLFVTFVTESISDGPAASSLILCEHCPTIVGPERDAIRVPRNEGVPVVTHCLVRVFWFVVSRRFSDVFLWFLGVPVGFVSIPPMVPGCVTAQHSIAVEI